MSNMLTFKFRISAELAVTQELTRHLSIFMISLHVVMARNGSFMVIRLLKERLTMLESTFQEAKHWKSNICVIGDPKEEKQDYDTK